MTISDVCIKRPVFTWVLVALPVVLGIVAYGNLGVDLFPNVDFPVCTVTTSLSGASVEEMETTVTKPIEDIINTVSGIDELRSTTQEGISVVTVQFLLSKDGDVGAQEVRDKVSSILANLPEGTETPVVNKFDTDAMPVMALAISGRRDLREVTELARKKIKERLETVPGVGAINLVGGRTRSINVTVDSDKLAGLRPLDRRREDRAGAAEPRRAWRPDRPGIARDGPADPRTAQHRQAVRQPDHHQQGRDADPDQGRRPGRGLVRGAPDQGPARRRERSQPLDPEAVGRQHRQGGRRPLEAARRGQGRASRPTSRSWSPATQSRFVRKSIEEVKFHLLLAAVLVSATILLFIRDWRTTVIATLAIPTSIIPTFLFMQYMGFTLNNITMLALILAIGIVIDDAVVVHENIFRHMEEDGMDAMEAASVGTSEIALAVLATSLSLVVIFLPVAFMGGIVGRFFSSFGYTVAFSVLMSLFVSFTLTPMLCSRFLKLEPGEGGHAKSKDGFIYRLISGSYGARSAILAPVQVAGRAPDDWRHFRHRADLQASPDGLRPPRRPE